MRLNQFTCQAAKSPDSAESNLCISTAIAAEVRAQYIYKELKCSTELDKPDGKEYSTPIT